MTSPAKAPTELNESARVVWETGWDLGHAAGVQAGRRQAADEIAAKCRTERDSVDRAGGVNYRKALGVAIQFAEETR